MSPAQGRFMSPDPLLISAKLDDPQTWNRYAYARNNPLRYTDPEGLYASPAYECDDKDTKACLNDEQRRILENSMVAFGKESLSGKALYEKLTEKQQNAFVNISDKLASVKLADGSTALSQVGSIFQFQNERFFANVSDVLSTSLQSSNDFAKVPAGMHAPFNDVSFKDTGVLFGNIQFSFNRARTGSDIDIDISKLCEWATGDDSARWRSPGKQAFQHRHEPRYGSKNPPPRSKDSDDYAQSRSEV